MGLCGCNLKEKLECSNGIHDGKNWHQIRISRSGERQKICRIVAMKIRGNILCSGELGGLCCRWNVFDQNLDMIDEMKDLPGAWIWKMFWAFRAGSTSPLSCLLLSRPFFLLPTISKRLLRRLFPQGKISSIPESWVPSWGGTNTVKPRYNGHWRSHRNRGTQRQFSGKYLFGRRFEI